MDKYLIASILVILANQKVEEMKQLFLQNRFGLYNVENHVQRVEHNFKVRLLNNPTNKEPVSVSENGEANSNNYLGFVEIPVIPARFREKKPINPTEILASVSGGDNTDPQEIMKLLKVEMTELMEIPNFGWELMVAKALQNTILKYKVKEDDGTITEREIDLKRPTANIKNYSAVADKKILDVIKEGQKAIGKRYKANTLILGSDMVDKFFIEADKKLNQRYIEGILQKLDGLEIGGYIYHGRYDGMDVFEYTSDYKDGADTKALIDSKAVIVTSTQMKWKKYFGAVLDADAIRENKHINKMYSKSWETKDPSQTWLLIESDSVVVPEDASGIYSATMA